ncbi:hypothetical protein KR009_004690, partial [Drosophila setifemur]
QETRLYSSYLLCSLITNLFLAGQFLPRAFFTLDSEGHPSDVHSVNALLLRRLRRQVVSSSSSSSSSGNGGTFTFASHSIQNTDGSGHAGSSYTQQSGPLAGDVNLDSRFGEDSAPANNFYGNNYNPSYTASSGFVGTKYNNVAGFGSISSSQQSYGSSAPSTVIQQTVTSFDSAGNQKVTNIHGATDQTGSLNVKKTEIHYPAN